MTVKQILKELKTTRKNLEDVKKYKEELINEGAAKHVIDGQDKWIAYYEKTLKKYEEKLPDAMKAEEEKLLKKIAKEQIKEKASTMGYIKQGNDLRGITPNGKKWWADHNWFGHTDRTLHCYTLRIEGEGTIFTSGTLDRVLQTAAQH